MSTPRKAPKKEKRPPKKIKLSVAPEILDKIKELTLFDDIFMGAAFDDQKQMTELLLREIMRKPDLVVISTRCEKSFANIGARSIRLDVFAKDSTGKYYNIEIQRAESGADVRRMRFHAALITSKLLAAGEKFKDVPEVCVIFICETDIFKKGCPIYEITRYNHQTGEIFNDGEQIVVVNGEIQDDTPLGTIMHDFRCKNAADAKHPVIRERLAYMKGSKEGQTDMGGIIEEYAKKYAKEYAEKHAQEYAKRHAKKYVKNSARENIRRMIRLGIGTVEQIAEIFPDLTLDEIRQIEAEEMAMA